MNKEEKIKIVERLVNEKHLTFSEGLALMETEKEYVYYPNYVYPSYPSYPRYPYYPITCGTVTGMQATVDYNANTSYDYTKADNAVAHNFTTLNN